MNKLKGILGIGFVVILTAIVGVGLWYISKPTPNKITSFQECSDAGYPVMESYPRQCRTPKGDSFTEDIGNLLEMEDFIKVSSPQPNQAVKYGSIVEGKAVGNWFFEASFPIKLVVDGQTITTTVAEAKSDWMTNNFVDFTATLFYPTTTKDRKADLILERDNPSGLPENDKSLRIPVVLTGEAEAVYVFWGTQGKECNEVVASPVIRFKHLGDYQTTARLVLEELLKGPTEAEKNSGYFTSINPDVKIQKFSIEDGVAKVDFDKQLEFQMGGSCRVSAIRAQITQTLKQFSEIKDVIISIDGRTEDILQP